MKRRRHQNGVPRGEDIWPIRKVLTSSDVDITHPFLTLPRQPVEDHILVYLTLQEKEYLRTINYVHLNVQDDSTGDAYMMKLKWRGSYYNLIGKWGKIVREKGLSMGIEIKMRWSHGFLQFAVPPQPNHVLPLVQFVSPLQEFQEWPIKKVLTFSDVDTNHPFLPLPRQSVEDHITVHLTQQERESLRNDEQVSVNTLDHDTGDMYVMKLKLRGNHYNLIGKWGKIIRRKRLGAGREIKLRWANRCLYFSVPLDRNASVPAPLDQWPIKKALTLSDIDTNHPFLTLPGKAVEDHILLHWTQQAQEKLRKDKLISINSRDVDTGDLYAMKLRWRGSYYNLIGKWGKIVREKELTVGKEIRECVSPLDHCDIVTSTTHKSLRRLQGRYCFFSERVQSQGRAGCFNIKVMALTNDFEEKINLAVFPALQGNKFEKVCEISRITLNKIAIFDDNGIITPGGVRIGTPAMTSRGCLQSDFDLRAAQITIAVLREHRKLQKAFIKGLQNNKDIVELRTRVENFASQFALPGFDG